MSLIYKNTSKYYDVLYSSKDYPFESAFLNKEIRKYFTGKKVNLLDVACGTGEHLKCLSKIPNYILTGLDNDPELLNIAKKKCEAKFIKGRMQNFLFKEKFDVITCLFSSIAYNVSKRQLIMTLKNFNRNLNQGGLLIFDLPLKNKLSKKGTWHYIFTHNNLSIDCKAKNIPHKNTASYIVTLNIMEKGKMKMAIQKHTLGLFSKKDVIESLKAAGFDILMTYNDFSEDEREARKCNRIVVISRKK